MAMLPRGLMGRRGMKGVPGFTKDDQASNSQLAEVVRGESGRCGTSCSCSRRQSGAVASEIDDVVQQVGYIADGAGVDHH